MFPVVRQQRVRPLEAVGENLRRQEAKLSDNSNAVPGRTDGRAGAVLVPTLPARGDILLATPLAFGLACIAEVGLLSRARQPTESKHPMSASFASSQQLSEFAAHLGPAPIGFYTDCIRESTGDPQLAPMQASQGDGEVLIDLVALSEPGAFESIPQGPRLKRMHRPGKDLQAFRRGWGVLVEPVVDTPVAALRGVGAGRCDQTLVNSVLGLLEGPLASRRHPGALLSTGQWRVTLDGGRRGLLEAAPRSLLPVH